MGRRRSRLRAGIVALGAAVVLLVGACADDGTSRQGGAPAPTTGTTAPAAVPLAQPLVPTGDAGLDAQLTGIARAVEAERGHPFLRPVRVELLDDAAFRARAAATDEPAEAAIRRQEAVLEAVGALPAGFDLAGAVAVAAGEGILGFYGPRTEELVVRGGLSPFTQLTVAHELTHALDDQWFPLDVLTDPTAGDDEAWAAGAVMEGSAQLVESAYRASLPTDVQAEARLEEQRYGAAMDMPELPPDLYEGLTDVYEQGLAFTRALTAAGGTAALDDAFRRPVRSSEQILHVDRFRAGDQPVAVTVPSSDAPATGRGQLGEAGLLDLLDLRLAPAVARQAAEGWGGDAYVLWQGVTGACLRTDVVTDTPADRTQLRDALQSWVAAGGGSVTDGPAGSVRLTVCR